MADIVWPTFARDDDDDDEPSNAMVAQMLLDAGVAPFPSNPRNKVPILPGWRRTTVSWAHWAWEQVGPHAMPGLDCESAGLLVVDCDGRNGVAAFEELCQRLGICLDDAPQVDTPSGGRHYYFADPGRRWRNTVSVLARGVDTRGVGGYVAAPGARRADGRSYVPRHPADLTQFISIIAERRCPPPPKPLADLLDALRTIVRRPPSAVPGGAAAIQPPTKTPVAPIAISPKWAGTDDYGKLSAGVPDRWTLEGALARCEAAIEGTRNDTLARAAFIAGLRAKDLGLDPVATVDKLIEAAKVAGLDDAEATRTADGCFAAGQAQAEAEAAAIAPTPLTAEVAINLAIVKAKALDAYKLGRLASRERALSRLARFCRSVEDADIRRALAKTVAAILARDGWPADLIMDAGLVLGLGRPDAARLARWADKKLNPEFTL